MMAITNKMWMNPPIVELVISPSSHSMINTTAIVYNIEILFQFDLFIRLGFHTNQQRFVILIGNENGDGHVIDHTDHTIDISN